MNDYKWQLQTTQSYRHFLYAARFILAGKQLEWDIFVIKKATTKKSFDKAWNEATKDVHQINCYEVHEGC